MLRLVKKEGRVEFPNMRISVIMRLLGGARNRKGHLQGWPFHLPGLISDVTPGYLGRAVSHDASSQTGKEPAARPLSLCRIVPHQFHDTHTYRHPGQA